MRVVHASARVSPTDITGLPEDWESLKDSDGVRALALSIEENGLIHRPVVRASDMRILAGRKRLAAMEALGYDVIEVDLVEVDGGDVDAELVEIAENLHRKTLSADEQSAARARYVELLREREEARDDAVHYVTVSAAPRQDRELTPSTSREKALRRASEDLGVSRRTLERDIQKQKPPAAAPPAAPRLPAEPPIKTNGVPMPEGLVKDVAELQAGLDEVEKLLKAAQARLTALKNAGAPFVVARWQRLYNDTHTLAAAVRCNRPAMVCPWCKLTVLQDTCTACNATGYIVEEQLVAVPPDLLDPKRDLVLRDGRYSKRTEAVPPEPIAPSSWSERRRGVRVEMIDTEGRSSWYEPEPDEDDGR